MKGLFKTLLIGVVFYVIAVTSAANAGQVCSGTFDEVTKQVTMYCDPEPGIVERSWDATKNVAERSWEWTKGKAQEGAEDAAAMSRDAWKWTKRQSIKAWNWTKNIF